MTQDKAQSATGAVAGPAAETPVTLAEALAPFLVDGEPATDDALFSTVASPIEAARMFADLAARLADLGPLPDGMKLALNVDLMPRRVLVDDGTEADHCEVVAAVAEAIGATPERRIMVDGSVHYTAAGRTAAGLKVTALAGVEPMFEERAEHAGHGCRIVAPKTDGSSLVVAECACGDYHRPGAVTEVEAREAWRRHAEARIGGVS